MHKINFKLRILLYFLLVSIIPFAVSWTLIYNTYDRKMQQDFKNFNYMYIQNQLSKINQLFKHQEIELKSIAQAFSHLDQQDSDFYAFLRDQKSVNQYYMNLSIVMPDGIVYIDDLNTKMPDIDFTRLHSYTNAKKAQELVWLEPYTDPISGSECIGMSIPLLDNNNKASGVLVGNISLKTFGNLLVNAKYMTDTEMFLINPSGYVKYHTGGNYSETVNLKDAAFILNPVAEAILSLNEGYREFNYLDKNWTISFSIINASGWKVVSLIDTSALQSKLSTMNQDTNSLILVLGLLCILSAMIASFFLSASITTPLIELRDGVKSIAAGNLDSRIEVNSKDEIREVAGAFNEMAKNLKNTYNDLVTRTDELYSNNEELQSANIELEASYGQLEATMAQLNESEEKYRTLMNNISDMVFVINPEDKLVYINSSVEKILGYNEAELLGKPALTIVRHKYPGFEQLLAPENDYREFEGEFLKKDGSLIKVEGSTKRVKEDEKVVGIQAIVRDVTQKKIMELQLRKKYNELQTLNRISNTLASTMDLNSMLITVVNQVSDITEALVCAIRLINDKEPYMLDLKALKGIKTEKYDRRSIDTRGDVTGQAIDQKRVIVLDLREDNTPFSYYRELYLKHEARYVVFTPIIVKSEAIGLMSITLKNKPKDELIELISSLSNNIAIAIDNAKAYESLKHSYLKTVQSLVSVVEAKDEYTESHSIRVAKYSSFIASEMGNSKSFIEDIWVAGVLHDIGKIGISDSILNKASMLTEEEYNVIKQHPDIAYKIVSKIGLKDDILKAIKHHHERYDGKGYPDMIKGDEISAMAAIISVADAFDAITSNRPYRKSRSLMQGINEIVTYRGTQFDPAVVQTLERMFLLKQEIFERIYNDEDIEFF
ncbi:MAG TPA: HD domain-containing phosphohydrolase [Patescibacteria group bacterium]|nr:HD domain-containing phosphohydrolase [Patescibacteria group bacterium]